MHIFFLDTLLQRVSIPLITTACANRSRPQQRLYQYEVLPLCHSGDASGEWPFGDLQILLAYLIRKVVSYATPHSTTRTRAFLGTVWDKTHKWTRSHTNPQHYTRWITSCIKSRPISYLLFVIGNNARAESNNWQTSDCIYFLYKMINEPINNNKAGVYKLTEGFSSFSICEMVSSGIDKIHFSTTLWSSAS